MTIYSAPTGIPSAVWAILARAEAQHQAPNLQEVARLLWITYDDVSDLPQNCVAETSARDADGFSVCRIASDLSVDMARLTLATLLAVRLVHPEACRYSVTRRVSLVVPDIPRVQASAWACDGHKRAVVDIDTHSVDTITMRLLGSHSIQDGMSDLDLLRRLRCSAALLSRIRVAMPV